MSSGGKPASPAAPLHGAELDALFDGWLTHRSAPGQPPGLEMIDAQRMAPTLGESHIAPPYRRIALAVSGGADSMALMVLAQSWLAGRDNPPALHILTVDHGLRAEAAGEATWVKAQAARLGLPHATLRWTAAKPRSNLQAAARAARYELMLAFCREAGIDALATAHTADDQAETMLMRLARGSGLDGVAGIPPISARGGVALLRPLLAVPRARLEASLSERGEAWIEDPSNRDRRYERVRLREAMRGSGTLSLGPEKLALSASRLHRARLALEGVTRDFLMRALQVHPAGFGEMALASLLQQPEEIGMRAIAAMAGLFGGGARAVRLARIEALHAALDREPHRIATLGGCIFAVGGGKLRVMREFGRIAPARTHLPANGRIVWDGRFTVTVAGADGLAVGPLGPEGSAALRRQGGRLDLPARIAYTLPAIWRGDGLVFTPCARFPAAPPAPWSTTITVEFGRDPP